MPEHRPPVGTGRLGSAIALAICVTGLLLVVLEAGKGAAAQQPRAARPRAFLTGVDHLPHAAEAQRLRTLESYCSSDPNATCVGAVIASEREPGLSDHLVATFHGLYIEDRWVRFKVERNAIAEKCRITGAWTSGFAPPGLRWFSQGLIGKPPRAKRDYPYALTSTDEDGLLQVELNRALNMGNKWTCDFDDK